jgi:hypothetical protein
MAIKRLATLDGDDLIRKGDLPLPLLPADAGADPAGAAAEALAAASDDATEKADAAQAAAALDATNKAGAAQIAASGTAAALALVFGA